MVGRLGGRSESNLADQWVLMMADLMARAAVSLTAASMAVWWVESMAY